MRIALGIEYDGNAFHGWQTQPGGKTVQDHLEKALARIADGPVATTCAGRTDAGVHATAQVVHFDTEVRRPDSAWVRGVNAHLPDGVAELLILRKVAQRYLPSCPHEAAAIARRTLSHTGKRSRNSPRLAYCRSSTTWRAASATSGPMPL